MAAVPGSDSAVIVWVTDENSTSQVVYSETSHAGESYTPDAAGVTQAKSDYGLWFPEPKDGNLILSHGQGLSSLSSGTTYYYRVISEDAAGNAAISDEYSFTTNL